MEVQQKATSDFILTPQHDEYIAYCAVGGIMPKEDGFGTKMSIEEFARRLDINPSTLWRWRSTIPDFWDKVNKKRTELSGKSRLTAVWNGIAMKAAAGNAECAKLYLKNFDPNYIDPMQKVQHEMGDSFADLIAAHAVKRQLEARTIIDIIPDDNQA
jgi:hypothetical protein